MAKSIYDIKISCDDLSFNNDWHSLPQTRSEARIKKSKYYFTNTKCKDEHLTPRLTSNACCIQCHTNIRNQKKEKYKAISKKYDDWYYQIHGDQKRTSSKLWKKNNPEKYKAGRNECNKRRKANKINATPEWFVQKDTIKIYQEAQRLSTKTGITHHVHHIVPLQQCDNVCGLHTRDNLIILTEGEHKWYHARPERLKLLW